MYIRFITFAIFFYFFKKKPPRKYFYLFRLFNIIFLDFDVIRFLSVILDYYNLLTNLENSGHFRQFMVNLENVYRKKKKHFEKTKIFRRLKGVKIRGGQKNKDLSVFIFFYSAHFFIFFIFLYCNSRGAFEFLMGGTVRNLNAPLLLPVETFPFSSNPPKYPLGYHSLC